MAGSNVMNVTSNTWKNEVVDSSLPVLIDFWAEWCGPCKSLAPLLDTISNELVGKLKVVKVNVDENQDLASRFSIRSIPTLLIMKNGEIKEQMVGSMNKMSLSAKISHHLIAEKQNSSCKKT